jgi:hypothetical protein
MTGSNRKSIVLQERDRHLLQELAVMRVADRDQAKRVAPFSSTTRANVRLLALCRAGLLRKFFLGSTGSGVKALYALSERGAKLINTPYRGLRRTQGQTLVADFSVMHQLRVNDLYCTMKHGPLPSGATFSRWVAFHEPLMDGLSLIPDGYAEIAAPTRTLAAFLEVDLGHEGRKVWTAKVAGYLKYAASGAFEKRFGHRQFRTLVVAPSDRRIQSLRTATAALTDKILWFTTFDAIERVGFWEAIWQRPKGDARIPLMETS